MNSITRLFLDPSWEMLRSLPANDLIELGMLGFMSIGLIAAVVYGIYSALFRRRRNDTD